MTRPPRLSLRGIAPWVAVLGACSNGVALAEVGDPRSEVVVAGCSAILAIAFWRLRTRGAQRESGGGPKFLRVLFPWIWMLGGLVLLSGLLEYQSFHRSIGVLDLTMTIAGQVLLLAGFVAGFLSLVRIELLDFLAALAFGVLPGWWFRVIFESA